MNLDSLIDLAFDRFTMLVSGGIFLGLRVLQKVKWLSGLGLYRRLLPLFPEGLGVAIAFFGGLPAVADQNAAVRVAAGLWCGYLASKFHKVLGQTILGDDRLNLPKTKTADALPEGSIPPPEGGSP